jgi:hypothetical protein
LAFPDDPLGVMVELYVGGAWVDITGDVYTNNLITITRGRADEASRTDAGTCVFVLNNTTGRYSSRNPRSDLFGRIGRNTAVRVSIQPGGPSAPRLVRFVGEVSSWPPKWSTARYVTVSATAAGILRRLGQGATPLASPMRREFTNPTRTSIVAYWPMEDGSTATEFASALSGGPSMTTATPGAKPAAYSAYAASAPLPTLGDGILVGKLPAYAITGQTAIRAFVAFPDTAPTVDAPILEVTTSTGMRWLLTWESVGWLSIQGFNKAGAAVAASSFGPVVAAGRRVHVGFDFTQSGSTITWRAYVLDVAEYTYGVGGIVRSAHDDVTGYTFGRVTAFKLGSTGLGDMAFGHLAVATDTAAYAATGNAMVGWAGEPARTRIVRLCAEEGIPLTADGVAGFPGTPVGPQSVAALLDLLQEAIDVDEGRLFEARDSLALAVRPRSTLYTQTPALTLDYAARHVAADLDPVDDDQHVHNDVTIVRDGGSSARAVAETGPLSILDPPAGVGRYAQSTTLNLATDDQCAPVAWWMLHRGTWDAPRYPSVSVEVHTSPELAEQVGAVDVGDRAVIINPPDFLPPEQIELLVEGYTETLGVRTWDVTFNASPGGPWLVAMTDDAEYGIADTDGSTLTTAVNATVGTVRVTAVAGNPWAAVDLPYDVLCGGEVMTVTSVAPVNSTTRDLTVTRGANGVALAHPVGASVALPHTAFAAL